MQGCTLLSKPIHLLFPLDIFSNQQHQISTTSTTDRKQQCRHRRQGSCSALQPNGSGEGPDSPCLLPITTIIPVVSPPIPFVMSLGTHVGPPNSRRRAPSFGARARARATGRSRARGAADERRRRRRPPGEAQLLSSAFLPSILPSIMLRHKLQAACDKGRLFDSILRSEFFRISPNFRRDFRRGCWRRAGCLVLGGGSAASLAAHR